MGKEYIIQTAVCQCKFGAAPGLLNVTDNRNDLHDPITLLEEGYNNVFAK